jgi:hypothetical protein
MMSKGKKPPERSKIERAKPLAYQRRAADDARVVSEDNKSIEVEAHTPVEPQPEQKPTEQTEERTTGEMAAVAPSEADAPKMPEAKASPEPEPAAEANADAPDAPAQDAKDAKAKKADKPGKAGKADKPEKGSEADEAEPTAERSSRETMTMPVVAVVGAPPSVPGDVEEPTFMPKPADVPSSGSPSDAAKPPGRVPSGDSRSLRRAAEFALIYRQGTAVITRFGTVGTRGQWRVVEYPTPSSASNAYAKECSRYVGEGFSDYRD